MVIIIREWSRVRILGSGRVSGRVKNIFFGSGQNGSGQSRVGSKSLRVGSGHGSTLRVWPVGSDSRVKLGKLSKHSVVHCLSRETIWKDFQGFFSHEYSTMRTENNYKVTDIVIHFTWNLFFRCWQLLSRNEHWLDSILYIFRTLVYV